MILAVRAARMSRFSVKKSEKKAVGDCDFTRRTEINLGGDISGGDIWGFGGATTHNDDKAQAIVNGRWEAALISRELCHQS
jgi:hypothetical protein